MRKPMAIAWQQFFHSLTSYWIWCRLIIRVWIFNLTALINGSVQPFSLSHIKTNRKKWISIRIFYNFFYMECIMQKMWNCCCIRLWWKQESCFCFKMSSICSSWQVVFVQVFDGGNLNLKWCWKMCVILVKTNEVRF